MASVVPVFRTTIWSEVIWLMLRTCGPTTSTDSATDWRPSGSFSRGSTNGSTALADPPAPERPIIPVMSSNDQLCCLCGSGWPRPEELVGVDGFTALLFQAGAAAKFLAGAPFLAASAIHDAGGFLSSRVHEYGSVLLIMAGVMNVLGVSSALDQREG